MVADTLDFVTSSKYLYIQFFYKLLGMKNNIS